MMRRVKQIALAAALLGSGVAQAAQGDTRDAAAAARASRQLVEQKEAFVKRMLADSPTVKRIEASDSPEARLHLAKAQESYGKALASIKTNDTAGADRQLNEATWLIGRARRLVPDPLTRDSEQRMRYAQMLDSVESLRASYQRHLQRVRGRPSGAPVADARLAKSGQLVENARSSAGAGQFVQANQALGEAEQTLMVGLSRVLGTKTIEYSLKFESPAEEYGYELERNRSYADLVPIAMAEFRPGSEAIREVQYLMDTNRQLREQAQQHAARKDHQSALTALRGGTMHLQNALAAAGLRVPSDPR